MGTMFLKEKISYYRQHWFVRNVATLQVGSFLGNFTQALIGVFVARILQPEKFGVYVLAMSLASLLSIFLASGSQDAVSSLLGASYAKKDKIEVKEILAFFIKITLITSSISLIGAVLAPWLASVFYQDPLIGFYAGVVVVAAMVSSFLFSISSLVLQVAGKIKTMMVLGVVDQALRWGLSLFFVFMGFGIFGAVAGHLIGATVVFLISYFMWARLKKEFPIFPSLRTLFKNIKKVSLKKYLGFSVWIAIDRNVANLYLLLPVVLTGIYISSTEVTYFKLAFGYINLALSLLGPISILLNVEFPKMKVENSKSLPRNFIKVSVYSVIISTLITAGVVIVAPIVFKVLYGENFLPSVPYVAGLFVYGALYGIGVGLGPMWRAINKVKTSIIINLITLGLGIPLGLWLINSFGLWGTITMVTVWFTASHFVSFFYLMKHLKSDVA